MTTNKMSDESCGNVKIMEERERNKFIKDNIDILKKRKVY